MDGDGGILQPFIGHVALQQVAQPSRLNEMVAAAEQSDHDTQDIQGKYVLATKRAPQPPQVVGSSVRGLGGEIGRVDGPRRRAHQERRSHPPSQQRLQHAHLDRTEAATASEDEGRAG